MQETALAFAEHDHRHCREALREALVRVAAKRGLRLTPARLRVLDILSETHRAIGAYEILNRLAAAGLGAQPPVAYRALDFLIGAGVAHRIERLNAYIACSRPEEGGDGHGHDTGACFLICNRCHMVAEIEEPALDLAVAQAAATRGFAIRRTVLEIEGLCPACREAGEEAAS